MASELSEKLLDAVVQDDSYIGGIDDKRSREAIDAELQEVRELLERLRVYVDPFSCWCGVGPLETDNHDNDCQRARNLWERMKVKE